MPTAQVSPQAGRLQALALTWGSFTIPPHKDTALHPLVPPAAQMKFITCDLKMLGSKDQRT